MLVEFSNAVDCDRYKLSGDHRSPWNWASNWVLERAEIQPGHRVLDLGSGNNPYILNELSRVNGFGVLADIKPSPNVGSANAVCLAADLRINLPFADNSFDAVLSVSTLEHVPPQEREACIQDAMRVLRPGGRLCVSIGVPLGFGGDAETIEVLRTHPFFADRWCSVHCPVDIVRIAESILGMQSIHSVPGADGFDEAAFLAQRDLIFDDYGTIPEVPDVANLRRVRIVEFGIYLTK